MYQILVKIPKTEYNEDVEPTVSRIKAELTEINSNFGKICVSNNEYEILGYVSETEGLTHLYPIRDKYEYITVCSSIIEEEI